MKKIEKIIRNKTPLQSFLIGDDGHSDTGRAGVDSGSVGLGSSGCGEVPPLHPLLVPVILLRAVLFLPLWPVFERRLVVSFYVITAALRWRGGWANIFCC